MRTRHEGRGRRIVVCELQSRIGMLRSLGRVVRWGAGGAVVLVGGSHAFNYAETAYWVEKASRTC